MWSCRQVSPGAIETADKSHLDGSAAVAKTIGIVAVAAFAGSERSIRENHRHLTTTDRSHRRQAISLISAQRYSIATLWSSTKPASRKP